MQGCSSPTDALVNGFPNFSSPTDRHQQPTSPLAAPSPAGVLGSPGGDTSRVALSPPLHPPGLAKACLGNASPAHPAGSHWFLSHNHSSLPASHVPFLSFFCLFFPFLNYRHFEKSSEVPLLPLLPSTPPPQCEQHRGSRMRRSCSRQSRPRTRRARLYFKHLIKPVFGAAPSLCPSAEPSHLPRAETGVLSARRRAPGLATGPPARTKGLQAPGGA